LATTQNRSHHGIPHVHPELRGKRHPKSSLHGIDNMTSPSFAANRDIKQMLGHGNQRFTSTSPLKSFTVQRRAVRLEAYCEELFLCANNTDCLLGELAYLDCH
jgi:hypothetical protein